MAKKILVCLDGSEEAERILSYATEQALQSDGQLILFRVSTVRAAATYSSASGQVSAITSVITDTAIRGELNHAASYLNNLAQSLTQKGIKTEVATVAGPLAQSVLSFIKDNNVDMVTMTAHGYQGWKRIIYGSVVEDILHECHVPILVVNPT